MLINLPRTLSGTCSRVYSCLHKYQSKLYAIKRERHRSCGQSDYITIATLSGHGHRQDRVCAD